MNSGSYENNFEVSNNIFKKINLSIKKVFKQFLLIFYIIVNKIDYKVYFLSKNKFIKEYYEILKNSMKSVKYVKDCVNLKGHGIENFSKGITSSLISRHRNGNFLIENDKKALKNLILETLAFKNLIKQIINENNITDIVVFNGRFNISYASMLIAEEMQLKVHFHETSRSNWTYYFSTRKQFDTSDMSEYFDEVWSNTKLSQKEKFDIGKSFFEFSQNKNTSNLGLNRSFLKNYNESFLFEKYKNYKIFSIFTSSDDEYFLFGFNNKTNKNVESQCDKIIECLRAVNKISKEYKSKIMIIIRVHPNDKSNLCEKIKKGFNSSNVILFDENSKVNSYDILNNSDLVFTYRTTLGVEAIYKWIPSVMLTDCVYWKQNVCLEGDTTKKINKILNDLFLKKLKVTKSQHENAIKIGFGYFFANGEYKYLKIKNSKLKY